MAVRAAKSSNKSWNSVKNIDVVSLFFLRWWGPVDNDKARVEVR